MVNGLEHKPKDENGQDPRRRPQGRIGRRPKKEETFRESLASPRPRILQDERDVTFSANRVINAILTVLLGLLALRFLLLLFGANARNDFASIVYNLSEPFVTPFYGIFGDVYVSGGVSLFDGATLIAMLTYSLIGWALMRMIQPRA